MMSKIIYILLTSIALLCGSVKLQAQNKFKAEKLIRSGNAEYADSNYVGSEEKYQLALLEDNNNFKAEYNLANTLFKQERYEDAAKEYEELLTKTP
ncbi:MAG: hypothetical protein B6I18_07730, partial [Bacteroidetes bacterium 4572_112]